MKIEILYEDNHLIVVYKPAGVLMQKGEGSGHDDNTLYWQVKMFLKERDKKSGNVFLGVVHRLDRPVSGIVLFAKTSKGAARISEQIKNGEITKIYHAVVEGQIKPKEAILIHYLKKDEKNKISLVSSKSKESYDYSELSYRMIKHSTRYSLVAIQLKTGRFHQIRAQLSHISYPIVGDKKYGSKTDYFNIALCATELKFKKATSDETVDIKVDWPEKWEKMLKN